MAESKEPSYYEIALTNRQVMTVFVILLGCVVAAFFSGVWVGRRDAGAAIDALSSETVRAETDVQGEALGELGFFSGGEAETAVVDTPPAATEAGQPAVVAAPPQEREPPATPPVRAEPPAPAAETTAETAAETAAGPLVVQVFSSGDRVQAERVVDRLRAAGFAALLSPTDVRERTMYRVRIGPFRERAEAERVADRVRREFRLDTWITRG